MAVFENIWFYVLIVGIIILIAGVIAFFVHRNRTTTNGTRSTTTNGIPAWVYVLIFGGLLIAVIGGILLLVTEREEVALAVTGPLLPPPASVVLPAPTPASVRAIPTCDGTIFCRTEGAQWVLMPGTESCEKVTATRVPLPCPPGTVPVAAPVPGVSGPAPVLPAATTTSVTTGTAAPTTTTVTTSAPVTAPVTYLGAPVGGPAYLGAPVGGATYLGAPVRA